MKGRDSVYSWSLKTQCQYLTKQMQACDSEKKKKEKTNFFPLWFHYLDSDNSSENQIQPSNCLENWVTSGSTVLKNFSFRQNWWNSSFAALSPSSGPHLMFFWWHLHRVTIYRQHYCFVIYITTSRLCMHSAPSTAKDARLNAYSSLPHHFSAVKTAAWISNKFRNLK